MDENRTKAADLRRKAIRMLKTMKEELRVRTLMLEQRLEDNIEKLSALQSLSAAMKMLSTDNVNAKALEGELADSEKDLRDAEDLLAKLITMESYIRKLVL